MEELLQLRDHLEHQRYAEAMDLLGEMEEMSRDDKINKIYSFAVILLLHLIKQAAEKRTTRSWDISIWNSIRQIKRTNQRRKAKGTYVSRDALKETIADAYIDALKRAALEAFEGIYSEEQLGEMVDQAAIEAQALALITAPSE
jgi:hypothetical protein